MGIFNLFKGKEQPVAQPSLVAATILTLEEAHRNCSSAVASKKEKTALAMFEGKLKEARKHLHNAQDALGYKEYERAYTEIDLAKKNVTEYNSGVFAFPVMERLKDDAAALQKRIDHLENQVTLRHF